EGAEVIVEHCDAAVEGQPFQKGFLTIDEEITAMTAANRNLDRPVAGSLNWGRSAIEERSATAATHHAAALLDAGLMRGVIFSGCGAVETAYGVWQDTHMPHRREPYTAAFAEDALLTEHEMQLLLAQCRGVDLGFLGIKIAARPLDAPVGRRIALLRSALEVLASAYIATR
ncbi:MAG: DUF4862 family protein, partial [Casimicrobiaceae bacterium]